jgi:hypothetical protein
LAALGVTIRAWPGDKLGEFASYRAPAPLEVRVRPAPYPHSGEEYTYDPEDHLGEPAPEPVKPRIRQLAP